MLNHFRLLILLLLPLSVMASPLDILTPKVPAIHSSTLKRPPPKPYNPNWQISWNEVSPNCAIQIFVKYTLDGPTNFVTTITGTNVFNYQATNPQAWYLGRALNTNFNTFSGWWIWK